MQRKLLYHNPNKFIFYNNRRNCHINSKIPVLLHSTQILSSEISPVQKKWNDVLFLPGLFGSGTNWRGIAKMLVEKSVVDCHLLDLRNHGASPHTEEMSYDLMAKDIAYYIRNQNISNVTLIGHSMGGKVSMQTALQFPELVSALVVVDVAPVPYPPFTIFSKYIDYMKSMDLKKIKKRKEADDFLKPLVPESGVRGFLLTNLVSEGEGFKWRLNFDPIERELNELRKFPFYSDKTKFIGSTLFLGGEKSDYIQPDQHTSVIKSLFPNSELVMIPGAGHWIHADKPEMFVNLVTNFLSKLKK
jgi:esterase